MTTPRWLSRTPGILAMGMRVFLCVLMLMLPYGPAAVESCVVIAIVLWVLMRTTAAWLRFRTEPQAGGRRIWLEGFRPIRTELDVPVAVFLAFNLAAVGFSLEPMRSLSGFLTKTLEWFIVFYLFAEFFRERRYLVVLFGVLFLTTFVVFADGLIQYYVTHKDLFRGYVFDGMRMNACFKHPNVFGGYLTVMVPLLATLCFWKARPGWLRIIFVAMAALSFWCLTLTFSRSAWIATAAGLTVCFSHPRMWKMGGVIAVALLAGVLLLGPGIRDKMLASFESRQDSVSYRINLWMDSWKMIEERPLFGFGPNLYMKYFQDYRRKAQGVFDYDPTYAHNSLVQISVEAGIPATLVFLWIVWTLLLRNFREWHAPPQGRSIIPFLRRGTGCGLIALFLHGLLDTDFFGLKLSIFFWVMAGLFVVLQTFPDGETPPA